MLLFLSSGGCKSAGPGMNKHKICHVRKTKHKHCHGRTRNYTEIRTSRRRTRKEDTSFRAGCVSDGNTQPIPMISLLYKNPKPRTFTAKTLSTLRSSRQARISCLPLRSLRLRGENAFKRQRSSRQHSPLISSIGNYVLRFFLVTINYYRRLRIRL